MITISCISISICRTHTICNIASMNICIYGIPTVVIHNTFYFYIYVSYIPLCRFLLYVNVYKSRNYNTSWPSQEATYQLSLLGHLFFNITNVVCAKKTCGTCLYMPQDGHWLANFEVIPPSKKVSFPAAKKMKVPH